MKKIKFNLKFLIIPILLFFLFIISCTDKFDIDSVNKGNENVNIGGDTVYIPISPNWEGFNHPQDILIGREPFIYIADTDNDRIVMMNLDGKILGTHTIKKPIALAQDYKLNLIVCAQFDTVINNVTSTFSAVYKIDLFSASHQIENAPITRLLPRSIDLNFPQREYTGVCVFYDNTFYVGRKGPNNQSVVDPDNSILIFHPKKKYYEGVEGDTLIGRVPLIDPISSGLVSANGISSLTSFNRKNIDFLVTLTGQNSFKTQWLTYVVTEIDQKYESHFAPSSGVDFIKPNKFSRPEDCAIDEFGNIYVADAEKDSIYKFNSAGEEMQSFGGPDLFNQPYSVAFFDRTLYVADTGNNRILRFILSTDIR